MSDFTASLVTIDPGHFHAALVQKSAHPRLGPVARFYDEER